MNAASSVYARVLGPARVSVDGADAPPELLWRKHLALLVYLARSPRRSRTREHLVGLLWSDRDEKQARHSLSEALRVLRRVLGDDGVQADVDQVRLANARIVLDCDEFVAHRERGDWIGAADLVQGEFLEGLAVPDANEFESWLAAERAAWRTQGVEALVKSAEARLATGDPAGAAAVAQRAIAVDAASELAARAAIRALALAGDRAEALRVAAAVGRALRDQLGATIAPETERLIARVREARRRGGGGRGLTAVPPASAAGRPLRPRPPLIGRGAELAALNRAWASVGGGGGAGRGQVVLVEGEPGAGKTRLVEDLANRARLDDAVVVVARAVPSDRERSWSAIAGLVVSGLVDAPGLAGAPPAALAALGALDPDLAVRFPPAGAALPIPEAFGAVLGAVAAEQPVLLALDDAQWTDEDTHGAMPGLVRDLARRPVLLVLGVARGAPGAERFDDLRARIGRDLDGGVIRLGRFDGAALAALVRWALPRYGDQDLERLVRRLERDTAGIPLLAVAMVEAVADGFKLAPEAAAWPAPTRTLLDSLPGDLSPAVVGAVCLQYRGLSEPAQQVLAGAAAGGRVDAGRLATATGLDPSVVDQALDELEWSRWLVADARGYVFTAPIARDILLQEMITPGQARRYRDRLDT